MCILDRNGTTDRQGTPMDYADRRSQQWPVEVVEHTGVRVQPEIFSAHEEADTRILLHTIDLATTHSRLIVRYDDTDILVFYNNIILPWNVYVRQLQSRGLYMNAEIHSCQQDSIEQLARCLALPAC